MAKASHDTVQRLLTATPDQRPEPLIRPNNKVPAKVALSSNGFFVADCGHACNPNYGQLSWS